MVREITKENTELIEELENTFNNTFQKDDVKNRFSTNIFTKVFIYLKGKYIIGYIICDEIYNRMEIINIEVLNDYRNKHIASILLEKAIEKAVKKDIKSITLEVRASNDIAIHLYEKHGFIKKAIREKYYNGENGILMEKKW